MTTARASETPLGAHRTDTMAALSDLPAPGWRQRFGRVIARSLRRVGWTMTVSASLGAGGTIAVRGVAAGQSAALVCTVALLVVVLTISPLVLVSGTFRLLREERGEEKTVTLEKLDKLLEILGLGRHHQSRRARKREAPG